MLTSITMPIKGEKYNSNRRNHLMMIFLDMPTSTLYSAPVLHKNTSDKKYLRGGFFLSEMYRDQADVSDMPLDGHFSDAREWAIKQKKLATERFTTAAHRASAGIHSTVTNVKNAAGHGYERAKNAVYTRNSHITETDSSYSDPSAAMRMRSNIDLCECSRRVQGHLAILYPELH